MSDTRNPLPGIYGEIAVERLCQDMQWGVDSHHRALSWAAIVGKQLGQGFHHALTADLWGDSPNRVRALRRYRRELLQVAASAVAAIEDIDWRHLGLESDGAATLERCCSPAGLRKEIVDADGREAEVACDCERGRLAARIFELEEQEHGTETCLRTAAGVIEFWHHASSYETLREHGGFFAHCLRREADRREGNQ